MDFLFCHGLVFHASRHNKKLPGIQHDVTITQAQCQPAFQYEKHLIGIRMVMPDEFAFHFSEPDFVPIDYTRNMRIPIGCDVIQLFCNIDFLHRFKFF